MRMAAKVDDTQAAIVDALRSVGCSVCSLASVGHGVPDLMVYVPEATKGDGMDWICLIEVKNPKGRGVALTKAQEKFHANWQGPIFTATNPDEALQIVCRWQMRE